MATNPVALFSHEPYLAFERKSITKNEFVGGRMWAMAGGSGAHARLAARMIRMLDQRLDGAPCAVYTSDLRIHAPETGLFAYPDASVVCGPLQYTPSTPKDTVINPAVIVEVLSPPTETFDRGDKFLHYRSIGTLREYLLISQTGVLVECYSKQPDGTWPVKLLRGGDTIQLDCLGVSIPVADIYEGVQLGGLDS